MSKNTHLDRYLETFGGKRLRRTPDEIEKGLDVEAAAKERLETGERIRQELDKKPERSGKKLTKRHRLGDKGKFTISCKPKPDTDPEVLESLTGKHFTIELDEKFYSWLATRLDMPYNGNSQMLLEHVLDLGLGEVIVQVATPDALEEHIRLTTFPSDAKS